MLRSGLLLVNSERVPVLNTITVWFCHNRGQLLRWSLLVAVLAPFAAWAISEFFAVDARSVVVLIAALLFAVWRPYRDSWLRPRCDGQTRPCASH